MWRSGPLTAPNNATRANGTLVCLRAPLLPIPHPRGYSEPARDLRDSSVVPVCVRRSFSQVLPWALFLAGQALHSYITHAPTIRAPCALWATRLRGRLAAQEASKHTGRAPPHATPIITSRLSRQGAGLPPWSFPLAGETGHLGCPRGERERGGGGGRASGFPAADA